MFTWPKVTFIAVLVFGLVTLVCGDLLNEALTHLKYKLAAARTALWQENFSSWTLRTTSVRQWSRRRPWSSAWICSERPESLKITLSSSNLSWTEMFDSSPAPELSVCTGESELFSTESLIVFSLGAVRNTLKRALRLSPCAPTLSVLAALRFSAPALLPVLILEIRCKNRKFWNFSYLTQTTHARYSLFTAMFWKVPLKQSLFMQHVSTNNSRFWNMVSIFCKLACDVSVMTGALNSSWRCRSHLRRIKSLTCIYYTNNKILVTAVHLQPHYKYQHL